VSAKITSVNQDQTTLPLGFPKEGETASQVKASVPISKIESGILIVVKSGQESAAGRMR
jgi:hypothetical protein